MAYKIAGITGYSWKGWKDSRNSGPNHLVDPHEAVCNLGSSHIPKGSPVPSLGCSCGFHAISARRMVRHFEQFAGDLANGNFRPQAQARIVVLELELSGRILKCSTGIKIGPYWSGYRASHREVRRVWYRYGCPASVAELAECFDCPVDNIRGFNSVKDIRRMIRADRKAEKDHKRARTSTGAETGAHPAGSGRTQGASTSVEGDLKIGRMRLVQGDNSPIAGIDWLPLFAEGRLLSGQPWDWVYRGDAIVAPRLEVELGDLHFTVDQDSLGMIRGGVPTQIHLADVTIRYDRGIGVLYSSRGEYLAD